MSWSASTIVQRGENAYDAFENVGPTGQEGEHVDEAFEAALEAAHDLLASGSFGSESREYTVSLSGHANPDHAPVSGWANDCVTVSIQQK